MNVSCFAGRLGGKSAIVSAIGDGQYARVNWKELSLSGVDPSYLARHPNRDGNLVIILTNPAGDWAAMDYLDQEIKLRIEDIPSVDDISRVKILHVDGFSFLSAGDKLPVLEAVYRARQAGCILSIDASVPAAKRETAFLEELFRQADLVFANRFEMLAVTHQSQVEAAVDLLRGMGPQVCVLKSGPEGSYIITPRAIGYMPAYEVDVVDTIAAGDAFIAAMLVSLCQKLPLMQAASRGSAAGALACLQPGSLTSRFSAQDIDALLKRGPKSQPNLNNSNP